VGVGVRGLSCHALRCARLYVERLRGICNLGSQKKGVREGRERLVVRYVSD